MQRTLRRLPLMLTLLLSAGACGDGTGSSADSVTGTYRLSTVNGRPLPDLIISDENGRLELSRGAMVLRNDLTYTGTMEYSNTPGSGPPLTNLSTENGTYTVQEQTVSFTAPAAQGKNGFSYSGTVSGGTLTVDYSGAMLVYLK